jgi:tetratricopeptide (TPR) repeat protein
MNTNGIEQLVVELSSDPFNPEINFKCAVEYEALNQTASAVSFYLRAAEYGIDTHPVIVYTSLLKMAHCFADQNDRVNTVSNCLLQAAAHLPERPEAYFLLAQFYERQSQWQECYSWAEMGLSVPNWDPLPTDVGYYGEYCLEFEKAVAAWWVGRPDESKEIMLKLSKMNIAENYKNAVKYNLERIGVTV